MKRASVSGSWGVEPLRPGAQEGFVYARHYGISSAWAWLAELETDSSNMQLESSWQKAGRLMLVECMFKPPVIAFFLGCQDGTDRLLYTRGCS